MFEAILFLTALPFIIPFSLLCFGTMIFFLAAGVAYGLCAFIRCLIPEF